MRHVLKSLAFAGILLGSYAANASIVFQTPLSGASQNPPVSTSASGFATVTLEDDNNTLDVAINWTGMSSLGEFGHIHCCTAPGTNTGVALDFGSLPNATAAVFNNSYNLGTFAFGNGQTEASFIAGLKAGQAYANIHDTAFPNGEIRGQLQQALVQPVPEPGTAWLLTGAVLGAMTLARRSKPSLDACNN
jgi:CHRD domain